MKHLFITLNVRDGEREHTHRILHTTNANNIWFAAQRYASTFWGECDERSKGDKGWGFFNEIIVEVENVVEITETEFQLMSDIFGGRLNDNETI
jgi:hypothetical protein